MQSEMEQKYVTDPSFFSSYCALFFIFFIVAVWFSSLVL